MPLRSAGSAARRRRVALGVLGPALVWRIVWLPWAAVGVAVAEPGRWGCWRGGIAAGQWVLGGGVYEAARAWCCCCFNVRWLSPLVGLFWKKEEQRVGKG